MKKGKKILIIVLAVLVLAAASGGFFGYKLTKSDKIFPKITAGQTEIGGLTKEEALKALESAGWDSSAQTPLEVTLPGGVKFDVNPMSSGLVRNAETVVNAAYSYGHSGNIVENLLTYFECLFGGLDVNEAMAQADTAYIGGQIDKGLASLKEYEGDSEYELDPEDGMLYMIKGWNQLNINKTDLTEKIEEAVSSGEKTLSYTTLANEISKPDFNAMKTELNCEPEDAHYSDDNKFTVTDEIVGCNLDAGKAEQMWTDAQPGDKVAIPVEINWPEVTGDDLRDRLFHDKIGVMWTRYSSYAENRCSNVALAASKINEYILYPGDEFSYNDVVGARTEEAGFLPAPAYAGLDAAEAVKDEIGGGACQVSSTLYAATLFAFLETVERSCHVFPVNYMQLGLDATVTIPEDGNAVNFRFRNNKKYPVKIVAYTDKDQENEDFNRLTVEIWGTLEEDDYMPVEFDARWNWEQPFDEIIEPAYDDRPGYIIKMTHETYGEDGPVHKTMTLTHREVYDLEGNLVEDNIVNLLLPDGRPGMDTYFDHP